MITTVTYNGRIITVDAHPSKWVPKWMPRIVPRPPLKWVLDMEFSRTPALARKLAKELIDKQEGRR